MTETADKLLFTDRQIRALKKEASELRKCLEHLTMSVRQYAAWMDSEMLKAKIESGVNLGSEVPEDSIPF